MGGTGWESGGDLTRNALAWECTCTTGLLPDYRGLNFGAIRTKIDCTKQAYTGASACLPLIDLDWGQDRSGVGGRLDCVPLVCTDTSN